MNKVNCKECNTEFLETTSKINSGFCAKCYQGPYIKRVIKKSVEPSTILLWVAFVLFLCDRHELALVSFIIYILTRK